MPRCLLWCSIVLILALGSAAFAQVAATPEAAAKDPDFALQGEYSGTQVGVQVVAQGKGEFLVVVYTGGLPGAGWNERDRAEIEEDADGLKELIAARKLKKIERESATMGLQPVSGGVVLVDGDAKTFADRWTGAKTADGFLAGGSTKDLFRDFSLHVEYRLPYAPAARGQARGKSGIVLPGKTELRLLDSFGQAPKPDEGLSLVGVKAADVNLLSPPLAWQTLDVDYFAPQGTDGAKAEPVRITVRQNGGVVHQDVELTAAAAEPGPLAFIPGDGVVFRNVWLVPRNAAREGKRPIIPGFERFHAATAATSVAGGRLLLGELNCVACHKPTAELEKHLLVRQAPVLDDVGKRIQAEYLWKFLQDPHGVKPGTPMPDLLGGMSGDERKATVTALVSFLVSTGTPAQQAGDKQAAQRGEGMYHSLGCVACHEPRNNAAGRRGSVPLGDLGAKYTIPSMIAFLQDPHKVRPSARMPAFTLEKNPLTDLATYLVGPVEVRPQNPNLNFAAYEGSWDKVPKFEDLKPYKTGQSAGLDLNMAGRENNFGMRFTGFLKIEKAGDYTFYLGSDDGSLLFIDGKKVADSDGVHPHTENSGKAKLTAGVHPFRVDYTQGGGEWTLSLAYEGPDLPRQDANRAFLMTEKGNPPPTNPEPVKEALFTLDPQLAPKGKELFGTLGCANCHTLRINGQPLAGQLAKPLAGLDSSRGCLAPHVEGAKPSQPVDLLDGAPRVPQYDLNLNQHLAIAAALKAPAPAAVQEPAEKLTTTMTAFNCYACHSRGGVGGPARERNPLFKTTIPEMGDEGRLPPPLDGVGDKLTDGWIRHVLNNGAQDRPYMLTRMPRFGGAVASLTEAFVALDQRTESKPPTLEESPLRVMATGRHLVGDKALSCIKCHSFGQHKATGIQAINLQTMSQRIREDWFHRYMITPEAYRPGTRMPTGYPDGKATIKDVYDGDPGKQLAAIWTFLKAGGQAPIPEGLLANLIELKPEKRPIVYRNFIEGLTPRGIAVGYPEKANLAWDANRFALGILWHGRFIDAGKHWEGRGPGFQGPLGDHIVKFEETSPLAVLASSVEAWPTTQPKERGERFLGYSLDAAGRPHFKYSAGPLKVEDFPEPVARGANEGAFRRTLHLESADPVDNLYFRAAVGQTIESQGEGWYLVNGLLRVRIVNAPAELTIRESAGKRELVMPVKLVNGKADVVQELEW